MKNEKIRELKTELHKVVADIINQKTTTEQEAYELWCYLIQLSANELKYFSIKGWQNSISSV